MSYKGGSHHTKSLIRSDWDDSKKTKKLESKISLPFLKPWRQMISILSQLSFDLISNKNISKLDFLEIPPNFPAICSKLIAQLIIRLPMRLPAPRALLSPFSSASLCNVFAWNNFLFYQIIINHTCYLLHIRFKSHL